METSVFVRKLNNISGKTYTVEEVIKMPEDGNYKGMLQHDNIHESTLRVYTGPKMTGNLVQTFALATPSLSPWKREIRIQSEEPVVYICYETDGDTVEADDINLLQEEIVRVRAEAATQERRIGDIKAGLEKSVQDLRESYQEITEAEIDLLDEVVPEEGTGKISGDEAENTEERKTMDEEGGIEPVLRGLVKYLSYGGLQRLYGRILARISRKVDKIEGKGLSTHDFTTTLKNKLNGIADRANLYVHPTTAGNRHIPAGGSAGQILGWDSDGSARWESYTPYEHDHDEVYLKKNAVTWAELAGSTGEDPSDSGEENPVDGGGGE